MLEDLDKVEMYDNFHDPSSTTPSPLRVERTITNEQVGKVYESRWKLIQSIFLDREFRKTTPAAGAKTGKQLIIDLNIQLERLQSFAKGGMLVDIDGNPLTPVDPDRPYRFTQNLAAHVDSLSRIMEALGLHLNRTTPSSGATDAVFETPTTPIQVKSLIDGLKHLQDLPEIERLINDALEASRLEGISTQQLLKTSYIDKGNEVIFGKLEALKNKLSINKEILATLTKAQELKNMIKPEEREVYRTLHHRSLQGSSAPPL